MEEKKQDFESSLKSLETENYIDKKFYRPIGYKIAILLKGTAITPNIITIISIFFGIVAGYLFYPNTLWINLLGFLSLMFANVLDCVDGQLARLTGTKSQVGRVLDGVAGDIWFVSIYVFIALRLSPQIGESWSWILASLAGASNLVQANITDYYKTLHLYFISLKKGDEFDTVDRVKERYSQMSNGINRWLYWLYFWYSVLQTKITPQLQKLLVRLKTKYGEDFPEDVRTELKQKSLEVMPYINLTTFNGRSVALLFAILTGQMWIYLLYEIVVLNIVLKIAVVKHEKFCKNFDNN
ncbi:MAG: CDP-alcohol phosphatidyltransferase family protein [Prevotellaceae bacterium]|jgi:phosphatidylglycerophosphate synthase|nr:CDP-alcohol phosphatidyltransferase family protein [Prevotellaceae bacterium]